MVCQFVWQNGIHKKYGNRVTGLRGCSIAFSAPKPIHFLWEPTMTFELILLFSFTAIASVSLEFDPK